MKELLKKWLSSARLPLYLAAGACLLLLPALGIGWVMDDEYHRVLHTGRGLAGMTGWQMFSGPPPEPQLHSYFVDLGIYPWWVSDGFRLSLFRPLSTLAARVDYWLWPESAFAMHLHSLLWFAALIAAVTLLYRRLMAPGWVAGLAALLYAIDDAHSPPAAWIANRNALIAALFGVLCLLAHDRWRRDGSRGAAWLAPLCLAAGLAGGEVAVASAGYLFAYALCLDRGGWRRRMATLAPAAGVLVGWASLYMLGDYGARGSGMYVDPLRAPLSYARALVESGPWLLIGQWSPVPADAGALLPPEQQRLFWWPAVAALALLAVLLWPLCRRLPEARFWLLGMLLSLGPIAAVFPSNRLLFFTGLGAMALLGRFLADIWTGAAWVPASGVRRALGRTAAVLLAVVHLPVALIGMPLGPWSVSRAGAPSREAMATIPADPAVAEQELVLVNAPDYLTFVTHIPVAQSLADRPVPRRVRALATGPTEIQVHRLTPRALEVRIDRGLYAGPLGALFRDPADRLEPGDRVELAGLRVEIAGLDANGHPDTIVYTFESRLEDPGRRWLHWADGQWREFELPAVGETRRLAAPRGPLDLLY